MTWKQKSQTTQLNIILGDNFMNSANQMIQAIKNRKALLKKERDESIAYIEECYKRDIKILDQEEKKWLEQFDDVPVDDIYKNSKEVKE